MGLKLKVTFSRTSAVLCLNRPGVHNVVDETVMELLESALDDLQRKPEIRTLILTGAGKKTFCAGGDLEYFGRIRSKQEGLRMSRRMQRILARLEGGPQVVIAAVNGQALGGGCEILTACHLRLAVTSARFGFLQAANGLTTGWGGGVRLFDLVGRAEALRLLLTAEAIDAKEALRIGLVQRVVSPTALMPEARRIAEVIANNSPQAIAAFLALAAAVRERGSRAARSLETKSFGESWTSEEFDRTLRRFQDRSTGGA